MIAKDLVFSIRNEDDFNQIALKVFQYQLENNNVYAQYVQHLNIDISAIHHYTQIPFLPIQFFKTQTVSTLPNQPQITFTSSGTTGMISSQHHVYDLEWYETSFRKAFDI